MCWKIFVLEIRVLCPLDELAATTPYEERIVELKRAGSHGANAEVFMQKISERILPMLDQSAEVRAGQSFRQRRGAG